MTIPSQFASWLAVAERDGEGGLKAEPPAIVRGRTRAMRLSLPVHQTYGDYSLGTFAAVLRAAPGGSALATYAVTPESVTGGERPLLLVLEPAAQSGLPASDPNQKLIELFLDITFTPSGGTADTVVSTRQLVRD